MVAMAMVLAGVNFASGFLKGINEGNAYRHQANELNRQADIYRANAKKVREVGAMTEDIMRADKRQHAAEYAAAAGEVGMGESPTTARVAGTINTTAEQNILNARYKTESEAQNYLYQALEAEASARALKKKKRHAFAKGLLNGTASSLSAMM